MCMGLLSLHINCRACKYRIASQLHLMKFVKTAVFPSFCGKLFLFQPYFLTFFFADKPFVLHFFNEKGFPELILTFASKLNKGTYA